jgi:Cu2+-exporting ATPase
MACLHCGEKTKSKFCCFGCQSAYTLINSLNLQKYYEYCLTIYDKQPLKVHEVHNELNYREHIEESENGFKINLIVEGIHCGSCIWLIENALKSQVGVISARLNLSTRRLVISWQGAKEKIDELVAIVEKLGFKLIPFTPNAAIAENQKKEHELLRCLFIAGFGVIAIMMNTLGIWVANSSGEITPYFRDMLHLVATLITVPAVIYSGRPFFNSAWKVLKARRSNMDVPISLATILAMLISFQELLRSGEYIYLDAAVSLVFFLLIGRYLDLKMRNRAREYAQNLILAQAQSVTLYNKGQLKLTTIKNASEGDVAFIAVGEKIPVDGVVLNGESEVDNSLITGETTPIAISKGSYVHAGTINLAQPLQVKITRLGEHTTLGEIIKLMETAEQGKARFVRIADRISGFYTPFVLTMSLLTLMLWLAKGASWADALLYAISVMIITCPCALGLAVPIVQVVAASRLMAKGIIVKSSDAFEKLAQLNYFIFDKTGTITEGQPKLTNVSDFNTKEIAIIAALAGQSKHPLCQAITREFAGKVSKIEAQEVKGLGMEATLKGVHYKLGSKAFCGITKNNQDGYSEMWFVAGKHKPLRLKFSDSIKSDAGDLIKWLGKNAITAEILSGDRQSAVSKVAKSIGVQIYYGEMTPQEKYAHISALESHGKKTLMVGDGLNDSAALKLAHASMSPASALEIAQTSADIIFQGNKLWPVKEAFIVAQNAVKLVKQNFAISLAYNAVTIPFAMLGYATPALAAIIMATSSIIVVANALRLRRIKD